MATKIYYNSLDKTCKSIIGAITVGDDLKITVISSDATTCRLILRYDGEYECGYDMEKCEDGFFISLSDLKSGLIWYYFVIDNVNYGNDGFCKAILQSDVVPFQLSVCKKRKSSCNLKKAIMYQIMPDRFARAEGYGDANGKKLRTDWGGMPEYLPDKNGKILNNDFFGGNLEGIRRKLPYLKSLGVTHIYLNPIFKAYSNHRYDTGDYLTVDPLLGNENDLINFIQDAKKYTICVILDGVFNHTGDDSIYFNKYGRYKSVGAYQSENSPFYNWYTFIDYPDKYESWWGISVLPTVRKDCLEFENFITGEGGVIDKYSALGVGGFRLDVVDELPDRFVKSIYSAIKKRNENNIVIGEVWEDATNKIAYGERKTYFTERELDGVMNYPLKNAIINFVLTGKNSQLKSTVISQIDHYQAQNLGMLMNILGTHDTPRILTVFGKNGLLGETREEQSKIALTDEEYTLAKKRLKVAAFLSYFLYGFPCVYYGDEIGMQGGKDPFNRRCFDENNADNDLLEFYKKLGKIKDKYSCLSDGETFGVGGEGGVFYFKRRDKNGVCLAVANCGELSVTITLKESADEIMSDIKLNKITLKSYDFTMFYKIEKMNTVNEYERVIAALNAEADAKFKDFSSKIVNSGKPLIGVRTPTIKAIVKAIDDEKAKEYLSECKFEFFEDTLVYGLLIARMPFSEFKRYLPVYLSNADSWAHIDTFVASVKCVKNNSDDFFEFVKDGLFDAEGFYLRFKIIALMDYYIEKELNFILNSLEKIDKKGYYSDMAIAWLLSVAFVKRKTETEEYLKTDNLSAFTHNAAIRKICNSFRVAAQDKIEIKKYLRKK